MSLKFGIWDAHLRLLGGVIRFLLIIIIHILCEANPQCVGLLETPFDMTNGVQGNPFISTLGAISIMQLQH
jgi:hypothetical protein